jgi:hypothetical protein
MKLLRDEVKRTDVRRWVKWFLAEQSPRHGATSPDTDTPRRTDPD